MSPDQPKKPTKSGAEPQPARSPSMHEDVELWCDCCSCEAEPRWREVEEEMRENHRDVELS